MASLVLPLQDGGLSEAGVVGKEGFVGMSALSGSETAPHSAMIQMPGKGIRLSVATFGEQMMRSPALLNRVFRFSQALNAQISQTAVCNARHALAERLARWLLMAHDRADADMLPLTQEFLSMMLGVQRAGVSIAAHTLQHTGAIEYARGRVNVRDRSLLEESACECYASLTEQSRNLIGWPDSAPLHQRSP
jgi:CRP-like cAMP-binding protein